MNNFYETLVLTSNEIQSGDYKKYLGSGSQKWDFISLLQFQLMQHFGLTSSDTLLEYGCGPGRTARRFINYLNPNSYFGVDINHDFINIAKNLIDADMQSEKNPKFYHTDDFKTNIKENSIDYVFLWSVLNHIDPAEYQPVVGTIFQSIKLNGKIITTHSNWHEKIILPDSFAVTKSFKNKDSFLEFINDSIYIDQVYIEELKNNPKIVNTFPIVEITKIK